MSVEIIIPRRLAGIKEYTRIHYDFVILLRNLNEVYILKMPYNLMHFRDRMIKATIGHHISF